MGVKDVLTGIGNIFTGGVVDKAIALIDKFVPDKDLAQNLKAQLETLRMVQDHELEMARISLEGKQLESETAIQVEQQKTFQAEVNQADLFTKRTRPKLARRSFNLAAGYAILTFVSDFIVNLVQTFSHPTTPEQVAWLSGLHGVPFNWEAFLVVASPALSYMGVRSFDIWKRGGAKTI